MFMRTILSIFCLLFAVLTTSTSALAFKTATPVQFKSNTPSFVPVDQAFPFHAEQDGATLYLDWQIASGYYLYQDRLTINGEHVTLGSIEMPTGQPHEDEFFGKVTIYPDPIMLAIPLSQPQQGASVTVQYQGCAQAGFCYPPETRHIELTPLLDPASGSHNLSNHTANRPTSTNTATLSAPLSQERNFASQLADSRWTPLLFLLFGIGLAFTPCVLPMYPILTSLVLGSGKLTTRRALGLAFAYVQGMALTYTLLGLVVASAGVQFQAAMQHPSVLIALSVLFVALSLSMFGLYTLQLPSSVQTWLNGLSNRQQGGSGIGVFVMGAISGLVCSPCTTAPLSGALLYVAQSGDQLTGAIALYALACGMGIPLIVVAVFGNQILPKAGAWMDRVKILFGFILLAAPIFLLERLLSAEWTQALWTGLGIATSVWLFSLHKPMPSGLGKTILTLLLPLGLLAVVLSPFYFSWNGTPQSASPSIQFKRIVTVEDLQRELAEAKAAGKPVMFDLYADWCVACKEFEKYTFHEPSVEAKLSEFVLLQADVTRSMPDDMALMKKLDVMGLPTIEFWNAQGEREINARLTGFVPADTFLDNLQSHHL